jgi:hypothetical protein
MSSLRSVLAPQTRVRLVWRVALGAALAALAAAAWMGAIDLLQSGALTMLPAFALAAIMLTRPYLGERTIARLRARLPRRERVAQTSSARVRPAAHVARGGCLIAVALAGRAPPLALAGRG